MPTSLSSPQEPRHLPVAAEAPTELPGDTVIASLRSPRYRADSADPLAHKGAGQDSSCRTERSPKTRTRAHSPLRSRCFAASSSGLRTRLEEAVSGIKDVESAS